jgi:hypothetical protein
VAATGNVPSVASYPAYSRLPTNDPAGTFTGRTLSAAGLLDGIDLGGGKSLSIAGATFNLAGIDPDGDAVKLQGSLGLPQLAGLNIAVAGSRAGAGRSGRRTRPRFGDRPGRCAGGRGGWRVCECLPTGMVRIGGGLPFQPSG